jgi:hypothetical protein
MPGKKEGRKERHMTKIFRNWKRMRGTLLPNMRDREDILGGHRNRTMRERRSRRVSALIGQETVLFVVV